MNEKGAQMEPGSVQVISGSSRVRKEQIEKMRAVGRKRTEGCVCGMGHKRESEKGRILDGKKEGWRQCSCPAL